MSGTVFCVLRRPGGYRIFELIVVSAVLGVGSFGAIGLGAAILGEARPLVVWPIGAALWVVSLIAWRPDRPARPDLAACVPVAAVLVGGLVVAVSGITNVVNNGQYVRADRDNGIYTAAAFWIANNGDVLVDGRQGPYRELDGVRADSIGQALHDGDDHRLEIHGTHLFPSLVAQGEWIGGVRGVQAMPAAIGLLALAVFFLFALWWLPPWIAVGVTAALGANYVFLYGVRSNLTEPASLALLFAGLWMALAASRSERHASARFAVAGMVIGLTLTVRVDSGAALAMLLPGAAALIASRRGDHEPTGPRCFAALILGTCPTVLLAAIDLWGRSPGYAGDLGSQIALIQIGFAVGLAASILILFGAAAIERGRLTSLTDAYRRHHDRLAVIQVGGVIALFTALGLVRPLLGRVRRGLSESGHAAMESIQIQEGFEPDGSLSFDEVSIERLGWYLGPVVLGLVLVGIAVLIVRFVRRGDGESGLLLAAVMPTALLYIWDPSVFPDQPWMMRRYLPIVIPGFLIIAGLAGAAVVASIGRITQGRTVTWAATGATVLLIVVLVLPPLAVTLPLRNSRWQAGGYGGIQKICDRVGDDAVLLFSNEAFVAATLMTPVRAMCGVPVLRSTDGDHARPGDLAAIDSVAQRDGRRLWVVAGQPDALLELDPDAVDIEEIEIYDTTVVRSTLHHPPADLVPQRRSVHLAEVER